MGSLSSRLWNARDWGCSTCCSRCRRTRGWSWSMTVKRSSRSWCGHCCWRGMARWRCTGIGIATRRWVRTVIVRIRCGGIRRIGRCGRCMCRGSRCWRSIGIIRCRSTTVICGGRMGIGWWWGHCIRIVCRLSVHSSSIMRAVRIACAGDRVSSSFSLSRPRTRSRSSTESSSSVHPPSSVPEISAAVSSGFTAIIITRTKPRGAVSTATE